MSIDYDLKSRVIELGLDELERQVSKSIFYHLYPNEDYQPEMAYELAVHYENFYMTKHKDLWLEAKKINHARYHRVRHLKRYIEYMLNAGDCVFLTFTFSKKSLLEISEKSRKTYVQRFLKSYDTLYVANKDFGSDEFYISDSGEECQGTCREHFHAVIRIDKVDFYKWKYGRIRGQRVRSIEDSPCLAQYVAKLTNHAIKETTKRSCLIYSRMTFADYEKKQKLTQFINTNFEEIENIDLPFEDVYDQDCLFG